LTSEIEALKIYEGRGAVRLLEADSDRGALLLERLLPGNMLCTVEDEERSIRIAANVLKVLWRPEPENHHFKSIFNWVEGLNKIPTLFPQGIPIPTKLIDQAKALFADLIATQTSKMLLHGDFHHYNILSSDNEWRAIDPKGIIGEPEFDLAPFLENEIDPKDPVAMRKITEKRITIFCEMLGFDPKRVKDWLIAHSILSSWWLVEDHGADCEKIETSLASIEVFQNLRF
jgi:streptomycin 6-kinase